ncbi:hypothetical protein K4K53_007243 [Colletotrichum sp. SAR 10_77]|nr:hypothetical protein K4K52_007454 [Colletotrichum sp. SAR 10_76]KAI8222114.1 hypothetical protein K4K53_007243 [Colletotrichum sp. SAR 10_77]
MAEPVDFDADPSAIATRQRHKAFRKMCACIAVLQPLNTQHGAKIDIEIRKAIATRSGDDSAHREYGWLECLANLESSLVAFFPGITEDAVMTGTSEDWTIFASVNPQWEEAQEADEERAKDEAERKKGKEKMSKDDSNNDAGEMPENGPRMCVTIEEAADTAACLTMLEEGGPVKFLYDQILFQLINVGKRNKLTSNKMRLRHAANLLAVLKKCYHASLGTLSAAGQKLVNPDKKKF